MIINRTTIVRGPCMLSYNGQTFFTRDGVTLRLQRQTTAIAVDGLGTVDRRAAGLVVEVEATPSGPSSQNMLNVFYPYIGQAGTLVGKSIFGALDKPLVITGRTETYTVHNAAITQMPKLILSTTRTASGPMKFAGLAKLNGDVREAASYLTEASGTFSPWLAGVGAPVEHSVPTGAYMAQWNVSDPTTDFFSENGFEVDFGISLSPVNVDGAGVVDMTLTDVTGTVRCVPVGVAAATLRAHMLDGVLPGGALPFGPLGLNPVNADVPGIVATLAAASLADDQNRFASTANRQGQVAFQLRQELLSLAALTWYIPD